MGGALFLSERFHQWLHAGGAQLPARSRQIRAGRRSDPRGERGYRPIAQGFCAKEGLNFKLLADPDAKVSTEYGSVMDYKGERLAARNTFMISPKGEDRKSLHRRETGRTQRAGAQRFGGIKEKLKFEPAAVCPQANALQVFKFETQGEREPSRDFEYLELVGDTTQGTSLRRWLYSAELVEV